MQRYATIEDLLSGQPGAQDDIVYVLEDGVGGFFQRTNSADAINNGTVFEPVPPHPEGLVWQRISAHGSPVNVAWFGAKGNFHDRGDSNADDTRAIASALDFVLSQRHLDSFNPSGQFKQFMPSLYFPPGSYRVTTPKVFQNRRPETNFSGISLLGAGENQSLVVFDHDLDSPDNTLIWNDGPFKDLRIENITFRALTQNATFLHYHNMPSRGSAQNLYMRKVRIQNFRRGIAIGGFGNSDKNVFDRCTFSSQVPGHIHFSLVDNTQSILHTFRDCVFNSYGGRIFDFRAAGLLNVHGGSLNVIDGEGILFVTKEGSGNSFGPSSIFNFFGSKFELHKTSDVAPQSKFIDINTGRVNVFGENDTNIGVPNKNPGQAPQIIIREFGEVHLNECRFNLRTQLISTTRNPASVRKPTLIMRGCDLYGEIHQLIETVDASAIGDIPFSGGQWPAVGRVHTESCRYPQSPGDKANRPADVDTHLTRGWNPRAGKIKSFLYRQNTRGNMGLPSSDDVTNNDRITFFLPVHATLVRALIVSNDRLEEGSVYALYGAGQSEPLVQLSWKKNQHLGSLREESGSLYLPLVGDSAREFHIRAEGSTTPRKNGFVVVEYI